MKLRSVLCATTMISMGFVSTSNLALSQSDYFTCAGLRRHNLDEHNAECLQILPSTQNIPISQMRDFSIEREGILTVNGGSAGSYDVTRMEVSEYGVEASLSQGSVSFISKFGSERNGNWQMVLQGVVLEIDGEVQSSSTVQSGTCSVENLRNRNPSGVFLSFGSFNMLTGKVPSLYATKIVECDAKDSNGTSITLKGMQVEVRD